MSQAKREQLSTLIDDELDPLEIGSVLGGLTGDREMRAMWDRYHLIGDAVRGEPLSRGALDVAQRVRDCLDAEAVVPLSQRRRRQPRHWLATALGSALAASVALLALLVGPGLFNDGDSSSPQLADEAPSAPTRYVDHTGTYWSLERPEVESKLNSFLVNHQEYARATGMKGILPYATFVSFDVRR